MSQTHIKQPARINLRTKGVVPIQRLKQFVEVGILSSPEEYPIQDDQFQPNSVDLRLGKRAFRVRCSFLPETETVGQKLSELAEYEFSIEDGAVLEPNAVYIIPLLEELKLPASYFTATAHSNDQNGNFQLISLDNLSAKANPKSSTGRLDIFTRVITDYSHRFEEITPGYQGKLYLEVVPKSFPVKVRTGQRLNQLRVRHGFEPLDDQDMMRIHSAEPILFDEYGKPVSLESLKLNKGLFMSVNLKGNKGDVVGYKARKHTSVVDLECAGEYEVDDFWEPIFADGKARCILEPEAFYIFASKEFIRIPPTLACEMMAYDTGSGELRTHYAGFFDSGFGGLPPAKGAKAVLEVRSHDVPFLIEDGQTLFSMQFEPNTEIPEYLYGDSLDSNYQGQYLKLGKHFKTKR